MNEAIRAGRQVQLAVYTAQHNVLAEVEDYCTGTAAKLKHYAPLLRHLAEWKSKLRTEMARTKEQM